MNKPHEVAIVNFLAGNATKAEIDLVQEWISKSSANEAEFREMEKIWKISGELKEEFNPNVDQAWEKLQSKLHQNKVKQVSFYPQWLKVAAAVILLVGIGFLVRLMMTEEGKPGKQVAEVNTVPEKKVAQANIMVEFTTTDSMAKIDLPDGSKIILNKNSKVSWAEDFMANNERRIYLEGEGYFNVTHNEKIPFFVNCGETVTRVTGTSFNVKENKELGKVTVTVISGSVEFSDPKAPESVLALKPNDEATYDNQSTVLTKEKTKGKTQWWKKLNLKKSIKDFFKRIAGN